MSKTPSSKTPISRTPISKTPNSAHSKPASRNGLQPPHHLAAIKYIIDIDVIKCPVCLEVFKSPRVLPCGHSMCLICLNSLILYTDSTKTKESFQCPVCRRTTKPRDSTKLIKQKWANQFPVNATIVRLLRNASIKNQNDNGVHRAFCEICLLNNTTRPAVAYCNSCLEHHCEVCYKHHEKREETREHEIISFLQKEENLDKEKADAMIRAEWQRKVRGSDHHHVTNGKRVQIDPDSRDGKLVPLSTVIVAQTVTASDVINTKNVVKLGHFNGKAPNDTMTSDFRGATFLTDTKVVLSDHANKKLKVFDVSHKTRVELITDITLRVDPSHVCRVDGNTVAVITERSGTYHIRMFTVRDKLQHFVHKMVDEGMPLGLAYIQNTIACSILENSAIYKYRLTRAQQLKTGEIKHDLSGNDIFRYPGVICSGLLQGQQVLYVADGAEFGITVTSIDLNGEKKSSVFFEFPTPKPRSSKKTNGNAGVVKSGRPTRGTKSSRPTSKKDDASDTATTTTESEADKLGRSLKQSGRRQQGRSSKETPEELVSGHHTFRRVDEYGRVIVDRKAGREIERPLLSETLKKELTIDLDKLIDSSIKESMEKSFKTKSSRRDGKAVERARKIPVGKVIPQRNSANSNCTNLDSTITLNSTINPSSTISTVTYASPPKMVYRADSLAVDKEGNIYVCMSSANKIHQMSYDGRVKREILTERDGLAAPKVVSFSPSNDVLLVTCLKTNKVLMFRLK